MATAISTTAVIFGQYNESGTWPAQFGVKDIVIGTILQGLYDTTRGNSGVGSWRLAQVCDGRSQIRFRYGCEISDCRHRRGSCRWATERTS
jgi:hypothetical protein